MNIWLSNRKDLINSVSKKKNISTKNTCNKSKICMKLFRGKEARQINGVKSTRYFKSKAKNKLKHSKKKYLKSQNNYRFRIEL